MASVWKDKDGNYDQSRCAARVSDHDSRWPRFHQCRNKPKVQTDGHGWCATHAPVSDTGERVYGIDGKDPGVPRLVEVAVVKRTAKRLRLAERVKAFDYADVLVVGDEHKTAADAWDAFEEKCQRRIDSAAHALKTAREELKAAQKARKK